MGYKKKLVIAIFYTQGAKKAISVLLVCVNMRSSYKSYKTIAGDGVSQKEKNKMCKHRKFIQKIEIQAWK